MIYLDDANPQYDPDMEIACCIPRKECTAALTDLTIDFGMANQREIRAAIKRLGQRFAGVEVRANIAGHSGRIVWCTGLGWAKLQAACQAYWDVMHPRKPTPEPACLRATPVCVRLPVRCTQTGTRTGRHRQTMAGHRT